MSREAAPVEKRHEQSGAAESDAIRGGGRRVKTINDCADDRHERLFLLCLIRINGLKCLFASLVFLSQRRRRGCAESRNRSKFSTAIETKINL